VGLQTHKKREERRTRTAGFSIMAQAKTQCLIKMAEEIKHWVWKKYRRDCGNSRLWSSGLYGNWNPFQQV
jgi:hypothetical protein